MVDQGRNDRCACGSGLKYKKCCGKKGPPKMRTFSHIPADAAKPGKMTRVATGLFGSLTGTETGEVKTLAGRLTKTLRPGKGNKEGKRRDK
ncbi:MAG: SEC-C metal-binding domain-containing protein [Simkaniaceae bacterium]|nr:SEC-C metal-binding domain-containing protein [Simkaniaceae bacterium]